MTTNKMAVISKLTKINIRNHCDIPENRNVVLCTMYNIKVVIISINVYNELVFIYLLYFDYFQNKSTLEF